MTDLNRQIAKIDGNLRGVTIKGNMFLNYENGLLVSEGTCEIPDYLAPENFHELVRVVKKIGVENDWQEIEIKLFMKSGNIGVSIIDNAGYEIAYQNADDLSAALAAAILEVKG